MRLEFFLVVIIVSIFRYHKLFSILKKFTIAGLMGAVVVALFARGLKNVLGFVAVRRTRSMFFIILINKQ